MQRCIVVINPFQQHIRGHQAGGQSVSLLPGPECLLYDYLMLNKARMLMLAQTQHAYPEASDTRILFHTDRQYEKNLPGCCKYAVQAFCTKVWVAIGVQFATELLWKEARASLTASTKGANCELHALPGLKACNTVRHY